MEYVKDLCSSDAHPEMMAAGFWGRFVFRELVRISGQFDLRGRIPKKYAAPAYLAKRSDADAAGIPDIAAKLSAGLSAAIVAGLVRADGDFIEIPGWDRFYDSSNAKRQKRWRDAHRDEAEGRNAHNVTPVTESYRNPETRRDETRQDEKQAAAAVPSAPEKQDPDAPRELPERVRAFRHALSEALGRTRAMPIASADRVWGVVDELDLLLAAHDSMESVVAACVTHALGSGTSPKTVAWFVQFLRELGPPEGTPEHVEPTPLHLLPAVEFEN